MKISIITSRYGLSGVPLAQLRFARALARKGHNVDYIVGYVNKGNTIPKIPNVQTIVLNKLRVSNMVFLLIKYLRNEKPDIIFTAGDHLNDIVALAAIFARSNVKISASSRVTPYDTYSDKIFSKGWILKQLSRLVMSRINVLTCVSEDMVKQYQTIFKNAPHQCVYNIVNDSLSYEKIMEPLEDSSLFNKSVPTIIAAGMLEPWKGFNDLILAISEVLKIRKVQLIILGEGSMRGELEMLIKKLKIESEVKLIGYVLNPLKYFHQADVFVLSSYVEGLPNVLVESMMCGCTPVSTDCPTGPSEVLKNGKYGYLVPMHDSKSMSKAIIKALDSPISAELLKEAIQPFSEDKVIEKHFALLNKEGK